MILELQFVTYIRIFFGQCQRAFPYKEILSFFGHCHATSPYKDVHSFLVIDTWHLQIWNLFPFFSRFVKKQWYVIIQIHFLRKRVKNQMAAVLLQVIYSVCTNYSKNSLLVFANTNEKYFVSQEYCIGRHDNKMCFLPNCRYNIILIATIKELLPILDAFCFNYQHVDCLYTPLKYRFIGEIAVKAGQLFDNVQRVFHFNHQNRGLDRMSSIARKRLLNKKYKNICLAPSKSPNQRKLVDQSLQTELNELKNYIAIRTDKNQRLFSRWSW